MHFENIYRNDYLKIRINTNDKRIHRLIENVLDASHETAIVKPKISATFHLKVLSKRCGNKNPDFFNHGRTLEGKTLFSRFGNSVTKVTARPGSGTVDAAIFDYQDSFKENIFYSVFSYPLRYILAHHGLFFLHGSLVRKGENCVIISGPQNSGKSTIALMLARNGFNILCDDDCYIRMSARRIEVFPFATKIGLSKKMLDKFPGLRSFILDNYLYGMKPRISVKHLSPYAGMHKDRNRTCGMVLFPKYRARGGICLRRMPRGETIERFVKDSIYPSAEDDVQKRLLINNFWVLRNLVNKAAIFELVYNDARLDLVPKAIEKLFNTSIGASR